MRTFNYSSYGQDYELYLDLTSYAQNPLSLGLFAVMEDGAPFACFTINLGTDIGNGTLLPHGCAFLDENNVPNTMDALIQAGLGEPYTRFGETVKGYSGFCEYPLFRFDMKALEEFVGPEVIEDYTKIYVEGFEQAMRSTFDNFDDIELDDR